MRAIKFMRIKGFVVMVGLLGSMGAWGQSDETMQLAERFRRQVEEYPQEKVHVMTDRGYYMGGDTIWFRGFVADAATHRPVKTSRYLYVELKDPSDSLLTRVKVMEREGVYAGHVALPKDVVEADYTLIAYTHFMGSLGDDYFFRKNVEIGSPFSTLYSIEPSFFYDSDNKNLRVRLLYTDLQTGERGDFKSMTYIKPNGEKGSSVNPKEVVVNLSSKDRVRPYLYVSYDEYRKFIRLPDYSEEYDVSFYPEGGYLIPGVGNKVAFKALSERRIGMDIEGEIKASDGSVAAEFSALHAGMGLFTLFPKQGEVYTAICRNSEGVEKSFLLPSANPDAVVLNVDADGAKVDISAMTGGRSLDGCRLVVHERGRLLSSTVLSDKLTEISLDKKQIPAGMVNAVLFDSEWNPLSERLFFIEGKSEKPVKLSPNRSDYKSRQRVELKVEVPEKLPEGSYAVAVTDDKSVMPDSVSTLSSSLLLSSELRGGIEDAAFYFRQKSPKRQLALDALLMTQGWRRYGIPQVVKGNYSYPLAEIEVGQTVDGSLLSKWRNRAEKDALINVLVPKYRYANIFSTDSMGRFQCKGFDFPENTTLMLMALDKNGKRMFPNFRIDSATYPKTAVQVPSESPQNEQLTVASSWENFVAQERMRYKYNGMEVMLNEIVVRGKQVKPSEDYYEVAAFRSFDWKELEKDRVTDAEEVLRKIAGLQISTDGYFTYRGKQHVALVVDGIVQHVMQDEDGRDFLQSNVGEDEPEKPHLSPNAGLRTQYDSPMQKIRDIPFDFIRRIDFLQPAQSMTLLGVEAADGAVVITTKRGDEFDSNEPKDFITVTPLGYQRHAEFYSPKYAVGADSASSLMDMRPTLYWNPSVAVDKNGKSTIEFYTSDVERTSYTVRIEGLTNEGEIIEAKSRIPKNL